MRYSFTCAACGLAFEMTEGVRDHPVLHAGGRTATRPTGGG
ncbi:hypothetical protein [Eilatimonas milleporae]|uniref:C2H2-type domain-containing protein n=1 Tax=Eilatimonas milleporae TaxID=911205 RepID=A0A3M0D8U3_9PROT|nr:hypothetical protein [Eilatimonas milleporae]RMB12633.1 hypothetical protein BXY39_0187 [Eilatimonas milleporae]